MKTTELRVGLRHAVDLTRAHGAYRLSRAGGRPTGVRLMVNSIPKSGTNLLIKAVDALPSTTHVRPSMIRDAAPRLRPSAGEATVSIGVDGPCDASAAKVRAMLRRFPPGGFINAHVPHSLELADILDQLGFRMLAMIRDPRDVVVSSAEYMATRPGHYLLEHFSRLTPEERITQTLRGVSLPDGRTSLLDIRTRVDSVVRWEKEPFGALVRFERLVGPQGGGSLADQIAEVSRIAQLTGDRCSDEEIKRIADGLFGGTHTFRKGQVGRWREMFTAEHRRLAAELLGDVLIELGYERDLAWADPEPEASRGSEALRSG